MQEESVDLRKELDAIYTPLSVAKEEIWRRWNDKALRKKVEDFLGGDIPDFLIDEPKAYLAKHVVSPNLNFFEYWKLVKEIGLKPVMPEYRSDKFVSKNKDKYYLGKLFLYSGVGKSGELKIDTKMIINFNLADGKRFDEIKTVHGESFIDFHHKLLEFLVPGTSEYIFDTSDWLSRNGAIPKKAYLNFLALFICNGVLFENFLKKDEYDKLFGISVVIPNFKKLESIFGVKPLIIATVPPSVESELHWRYYPEKIKTRKI